MGKATVRGKEDLGDFRRRNGCVTESKVSLAYTPLS
jgi:hypothetical protein